MGQPQLRLIKKPTAQNAELRATPIGRILVENGKIDQGELVSSLQFQKRSHLKLGEILAANGTCDEISIYKALARQHRVQFLSTDMGTPDASLVGAIDPILCLEHLAVPWMKIANLTVIATAKPDSFEEFLSKVPDAIKPVVMAIAPKSQIETHLLSKHAEIYVEQAEHGLPTAFSCQNAPALLKQILWLAGLLALAAIATINISPIHWVNSIFTLSIFAMISSMLLKTASTIAHFTASSNKVPPPLPQKLPPVSLLVPLYDESDILPDLLGRLAAIDYPKPLLDILLITESKDHRTHKMLKTQRLPNWMRVITVPEGSLTTKPRAMNFALPFVRGDIIGIYDAEDAPHHNQINEVVAHFTAAPQKTACIQAVLDFYNPRANLISRFFTIEYTTWFRVILPGLARLGFAIPLGGTSVFFRREVLTELHGWDAHNVTEDADLGIRLARAGYKTDLITSVTLEEANNRPWPWVKQRSRWLKGYMITYLTHIGSPSRLLSDLGPWRFFGFNLFFLASLAQFLLAPFILVSMVVSFAGLDLGPSNIRTDLHVPLVMTFGIAWVVNCVIYASALNRPEHRHLLPFIPAMGAYMLLGTAAIYKGAWEILRRPFYWDKTMHGAAKTSHSSETAASNLSRVTKATEI